MMPALPVQAQSAQFSSTIYSFGGQQRLCSPSKTAELWTWGENGLDTPRPLAHRLLLEEMIDELAMASLIPHVIPEMREPYPEELLALRQALQASVSKEADYPWLKRKRDA